MRISDLLNEGPMGTIANATGMSGATAGQMFKSAALGALGLKNTQNQYQQKHAIGSYNWDNAQEIVKQLGIKQGQDFQIGPNQKVKITKIDNTGATYIDPNTKLPVVLGKDALQGIAQRQQAVQTMAQMGQQPSQATQPPAQQKVQ